MKHRRIMTLCAVFAITIFLLTATHCMADQEPVDGNSAAELEREVKEALSALKDYSADKRDDALEKGKKAMDALDERIEDMESLTRKRWAQMDQAAREKTQSALKSLRKKRNQVAEWYGAMKQSTADAWEHVKNGFLESYEAISETYGKAVKEF
jgi:uncharacterized protein YicC (UPF0701 family)